jgi:antitoxin Phd
MSKRRGRTKQGQASRGAEGKGHHASDGRGSPASSKTGHIDKIRPRKKRLPFVAFMESLHVERLDLSRNADHGRDVDL